MIEKLITESTDLSDARMRVILQNGNEGTHYANEENERKSMPVYSGVLKYFPNAIKYVAYVSKKGNEQHHPDKPLHWDMDKSTDEPDALLRHLIDHSINPIDEDGVLHLGKTVWRGLAMLERYLTNNNK
jgi:hypothetical protein